MEKIAPDVSSRIKYGIYFMVQLWTFHAVFNESKQYQINNVKKGYAKNHHKKNVAKYTQNIKRPIKMSSVYFDWILPRNDTIIEWYGLSHDYETVHRQKEWNYNQFHSIMSVLKWNWNIMAKWKAVKMLLWRTLFA